MTSTAVDTATPYALLHRALAERDQVLGAAIELCALPHWLDDALAVWIVEELASANGRAASVIERLKRLPFIQPYEGRGWRYSQQARHYFLEGLSDRPDFQELNALVGQRLASATDDRLASIGASKARDWQVAYHFAPSDPAQTFERLVRVAQADAEFVESADVQAAFQLFREQSRWLSGLEGDMAYFHGLDAYRKHRWKAAAQHLRRVWEEGTYDTMRVVAGHLLGRISARPGASRRQLIDAEGILEDSLQLAHDIDDRRGVAHIQNTLGGVLTRLKGKNASGEDRLERGESLLRATVEAQKQEMGAAIARHSLARNLLEHAVVMGRRDASDPRIGRYLQEADELLNASLALGHALGRASHEAQVLVSLSQVAETRGDIDLACRYMWRSLKLNQAEGLANNVDLCRRRMRKLGCVDG